MVEGSPIAAELHGFPSQVPIQEESHRIYRLACSAALSLASTQKKKGVPSAKGCFTK